MTALKTGVDNDGNELCAAMPRYGAPTFTDQQLHDIAAYLLSL